MPMPVAASLSGSVLPVMTALVVSANGEMPLTDSICRALSGFYWNSSVFEQDASARAASATRPDLMKDLFIFI